MIELKSVQTKPKKRMGRGISAGQGKTAGRGTKGQKSRSGYNLPKRHEGGQTPLSMRLPKLPGFKSHKAKAFIISLDQISSSYKDGETVSISTLLEKNLIERDTRKVKILNNGELSVKVSLEKVLVSKSIENLFAQAKEVVAAKKPSTPAKAVDKTPAEPKAKVAPKKETKPVKK